MDYLIKIILYIFGLAVVGMTSLFIQVLEAPALAIIWLVGYFSLVLYLAHKKGRSKSNWFLISAFLTPFAGLSIILFSNLNSSGDQKI